MSEKYFGMSVCHSFIFTSFISCAHKVFLLSIVNSAVMDVAL